MEGGTADSQSHTCYGRVAEQPDAYHHGLGALPRAVDHGDAGEAVQHRLNKRVQSWYQIHIFSSGMSCC